MKNGAFDHSCLVLIIRPDWSLSLTLLWPLPDRQDEVIILHQLELMWAQNSLPLCSGDKRLVLALTLLCLFSSSELRAGGPPPGTRPAEDEAGRHAAGRPGPDLTPERHGGRLAQSLPSAPSFSLSGTRLTARACQPLSCLLRQRQPAGSSKLTNQQHPEKRRWHDPGGHTSLFTERNNVHNRAQMLEDFFGEVRFIHQDGQSAAVSVVVLTPDNRACYVSVVRAAHSSHSSSVCDAPSSSSASNNHWSSCSFKARLSISTLSFDWSSIKSLLRKPQIIFFMLFSRWHVRAAFSQHVSRFTKSFQNCMTGVFHLHHRFTGSTLKMKLTFWERLVYFAVTFGESWSFSNLFWYLCSSKCSF